MAVEVTIKSKGLFKKSLTFKDLILEDMRYGIMDEAYRLEEGKIGEYTVIFNAKSICRGYEISLKKGEVNLRMPLPTSSDDIKFFYEYIKTICNKMNTKVFIRDEEKKTFNDIPTCIEQDIITSKKALEQIETDLDEKKYKSLYIFGAINPVTLGKKEVIEIKNNPEKMGEVMNRLQTMDVYYAKAKVYQREDKTYFGVYVLTENIPSVLPYEAKILMKNEELKINDWNIGFVVNEKLEGFIPYKDFLNSIKKDEEYDTEHFLITLTAKEIKELIKKYKVEL